MKVIKKKFPVGSTKTLSYDLQTKTRTAAVFSDNDVDSATVLAYEVGDGVNGQVDSGTASTVVDDARTEANDFWNGMVLEFTSGDNEGQARVISDFTAADDTITLDVTTDALPATPAADDEYIIRGYPIIQRTDLSGYANGSVNGNTVSFTISAANGCTASPRTIIVLLAVTYTAGGSTDVEKAAWKIEVTEDYNP